MMNDKQGYNEMMKKWCVMKEMCRKIYKELCANEKYPGASTDPRSPLKNV